MDFQINILKGVSNRYHTHATEVIFGEKTLFETFTSESDAEIAGDVIKLAAEKDLDAKIFGGDGVVIIRYSDEEGNLHFQKFATETSRDAEKISVFASIVLKTMQEK